MGGNKVSKGKRKKVLISILVVIVLISAIFVYINSQLKPLAEDKRNISNTDVKMIVDLVDTTDRTPIIRTYTKEEFDSFTEKELKEVREVVSGNIEGDVPAFIIENGNEFIKLNFQRNEERIDDVESKVNPDNNAEIRIFPLDSLYSHRKHEPGELRVINDLLAESEDSGTYEYEIKRHLNEELIYKDEEGEFFVEAAFIEIEYKIDNKTYVSIFGLNIFEPN